MSNSNPLRAILPATGVQNAKNLGDKKEVVGQYKVVGLRMVNGVPEFRELVDLRIYMSRSRTASTVYASLWVHGADFYTTGHGCAGGYGYCKRSAAADSAIASAKIDLRGSAYSSRDPNYADKASIHGVGETAIQNALYAIGEALGYDRAYLNLVTC
jgi:hypothetical protein